MQSTKTGVNTASFAQNQLACMQSTTTEVDSASFYSNRWSCGSVASARSSSYDDQIPARIPRATVENTKKRNFDELLKHELRQFDTLGPHLPAHEAGRGYPPLQWSTEDEISEGPASKKSKEQKAKEKARKSAELLVFGSRPSEFSCSIASTSHPIGKRSLPNTSEEKKEAAREAKEETPGGKKYYKSKFTELLDDGDSDSEDTVVDLEGLRTESDTEEEDEEDIDGRNGEWHIRLILSPRPVIKRSRHTSALLKVQRKINRAWKRMVDWSIPEPAKKDKYPRPGKGEYVKIKGPKSSPQTYYVL